MSVNIFRTNSDTFVPLYMMFSTAVASYDDDNL